MNESNNPQLGIHRRDLIKGATAASLGIAAGAIGIPESLGQARSTGSGQASVSNTTRRNLIQIENAKPGTRDWQLTNTLTDPTIGRSNVTSGRCPWIEGYCSANSVRAGETLKIMVSTEPETDFKLEIFRTGYYNGDGARLVKQYGALKGKPQPVPEVGENYVHECNWEPAVELTIPDDWLSGVYLGKLTAEFSGTRSLAINTRTWQVCWRRSMNSSSI